ncbi:unnamed protein product [Nippostrongylus brasiliensis]|uniref:Large ribosomal subunit protein mL38 n=1 Tax=Nippostrongylus brasiliensis TaxID=27835 RepID=A0A0N4XJ20_NIPBR|nr:unnamed protein product [Nippostrongylus brasiliensis]
MSAKEYARLVPRMHRARRTPVIDRPMRPRMIAWAGPAAFYPNRFYEIDKWYKGRIDKPEQVPKMHVIDPTNHLHSLAEFFERQKPDQPSIDIGFAPRPQPVSTVKTVEERAELERKARKLELWIDPETTQFDSLEVIKHYGVFEHLFGPGTFFVNVQNLDVAYGDNAVYFGNHITAETTTVKPQVKIESVKPGGFNTLVMVNLDGNPYEKEGEIIHWMVANIPDGKEIQEGQEVVQYLQPLPFCGTGYHRVAFLLFRHEQRLDSLPKLESASLSGRILLMPTFYKQNEEKITPSSIAFFQTSYDITVKDKLHAMGLKSPIYEYQYNPALKPEQKEFPKKPQPFDL